MVKEYSIEPDIYASAGNEAIQKVATDGNIIHFPFDEIETRSNTVGDPDAYAFKDVLQYIDSIGQYDTRNSLIHLRDEQMGIDGKISWAQPTDERIIKHITKDPAKISQLKRQGKNVEMPAFLVYGIEALKQGLVSVDRMDQLETVQNNQYIECQGKVYHVRDGNIAKVDTNKFNSHIPSLQPRNLEQRLAWMNLRDPELEINFLTGGSGSGKTVIGYAAAFERILGNEKLRAKGEVPNGIVIFKTNDIIGGKDREFGFLKGTLEEKTQNYMKSYEDAHVLCGLGELIPFQNMLEHPRENKTRENKGKRSRGPKKVNFDGKYLPKKNPAIEIDHLQFARGRTFHSKIYMVDEAQNYTPFEMKTFLERVGPGGVVYMIGDPEQVDNPKLTPEYNGLVFAANKLKDKHKQMGMMHLNENYRSNVANIMRGIQAPRD